MDSFDVDSNLISNQEIVRSKWINLSEYFVRIHKSNGFKWWEKTSWRLAIVPMRYHLLIFLGQGVDKLQSMNQIWPTSYFYKYNIIETKPHLLIYICLRLLSCYNGRVELLSAWSRWVSAWIRDPLVCKTSNIYYLAPFGKINGLILFLVDWNIKIESLVSQRE